MEASKHPNNNALSFKSTLDLYVKEFSLDMKNGVKFHIPIRSDGMVNATEMCKVWKKQWSEYIRSRRAKNIITALEDEQKSKPESLRIEIVSANVGGNHSGTWIHSKVALDLAHWLSPDFGIQMYKFLSELENTEKIENIKQIIKPKELELNGMIVLAREDGMINATQMCKAGGKKFNDWCRLDSTNELISELESEFKVEKSETGIPVSQIIDVRKGNSEKFSQGSWIHQDLAVPLAQWLSPKFGIQMYKLVSELEKPKQIICDENEIVEYSLELESGSTFLIPLRKKDGYVNVTKLCSAAGKRLDNWKRTEAAKELLSRMKVIPHYRGITILDSFKGNSKNKEQGTFAHPDLAPIIAQWCCPDFAIQVGRMIRELLLTGKVELGNEKSSAELDKIYEEKYQSLLTTKDAELQLIMKDYDQLIFRNSIEPKNPMDPRPFYNKDVLYFFEFIAKATELANQSLLDKPNIHFFEFGRTSNLKQRIDDYGISYKFVNAFLYSNGSELGHGEKYCKQVVFHAGLKLNIKVNGKEKNECFYVESFKELENIYEAMEKHSSASSKVEERNVDVNIELEKYQIDSEIEKHKTELITGLFRDGLITFEQYMKMMKI